MKNIQAILLGCGAVGGEILRDSCQKGVDYIGVFDVNPEIIGRDFGTVVGIAEMGVAIRHIDELEAFIKSHSVDIAINTATAPAEVTKYEVKLLLSNKINVLTSLADMYVMKAHHPELYQELDALAKENSVTYFSSGIQDVFWTALPVALTGCSVEISQIRGTNVALIDCFGPGVADECYVGWDLEDFNKANESGQLPMNDFLIALAELVHKLQLHPLSESSTMKPLLAKEDIYLETIKRHVKKGQLIGNYVESRITTQEGIDLVCDFVSKMSEEGDTDLNKWEITGTPSINVITEHMQGEITTGSSIINRIPDVINAAPGVASASQMPAPFFKVHKLCDYIKRDAE